MMRLPVEFLAGVALVYTVAQEINCPKGTRVL
jgi:hypothetical protein